jgi:hypothetical protein
MADVVADLERLIRLALHQAVVILAGPHASTMYDWDSLITRTIDTTATVEADAPGPAPGGMTAALADRFVAQLTPAAVEVLALLCHNAPELTYEDLQAQAQAQLGISRAQVGGVLTSLAAGRKRLPRDVDYPIQRDAQHRRYRIEPVAAELLLSAIDRSRGTGPPRG